MKTMGSCSKLNVCIPIKAVSTAPLVKKFNDENEKVFNLNLFIIISLKLYWSNAEL